MKNIYFPGGFQTSVGSNVAIKFFYEKCFEK